MKFLFAAFLILFNLVCVYGQSPNSEGETFFSIELNQHSQIAVKTPFENPNSIENQKPSERENSSENKILSADFLNEKIEVPKFDLKTVIKREWKTQRILTPLENDGVEIYELKELDNDETTQSAGKDKFHWKPALIQSGIFLGIQHGFRMTQAKTRRELGGKFFKDWGKSVRRLHGWNDSDNFFTNYIAHPLQGSLTGRIFVNNSDFAKRQQFGRSKDYWESRLKAMIWSTAWSIQFELGPLSEASLGNVGIRDKRGYSTMAMSDLVITPTVGTGVLIFEDALDKYILKNLVEKRIKNRFIVRTLRIMLNPTTSFANVLRARRPSWREGRPL